MTKFFQFIFIAIVFHALFFPDKHTRIIIIIFGAIGIIKLILNRFLWKAKRN